MGTPGAVTELLAAWSAGDQAARDSLMPLVYDELRRLARRQMGRERPDHTLQATALVNEAYLRLAGQNAADWRTRAQFFAIAAEMMRRILVDHARRRTYAKRGAGAVHVELDEALIVADERGEEDLLRPETEEDEALSLADFDDEQ